MDILIKSFNRPYYLERCLRSIYDNVEGSYKIFVLDDGTPPVYLEKLKASFPDVSFIVSDLYEEKVRAIEDHISGKKKFNMFQIPTSLWVEQVKKSSDIFLLLEDDIWITGSVPVQDIINNMRKQNVVLTKLYWGSNPKFFDGNPSSMGAEMQEIVPRISRLPLFILKILFLNKFKITSVLQRLMLLKPGIQFQLPFYQLYSVASTFFSKEYWLHLWSIDQKKADESYQLLQAVKWFRMSDCKYAKTKIEKSSTSFISSATNMYKDIPLDIFHLNFQLNQAWLNGDLDPMNNYPYDFSVDYLGGFIKASNDPKASFSNWLLWINRFKGIYRDMGVDVDRNNY